MRKILMALLLVFPCAAWANATRVTHSVEKGDCIRALLLQNNCITSMEEYQRARSEFARLNEGIRHSELLPVGSSVEIPVLRQPCGYGLRFDEVRVLRIEVENEDASEKLRVYLNGPAAPEVFVLREGANSRIICDFDGTLPGKTLPRELEIQKRIIGKIRVGQSLAPYERTRIVLDVDGRLLGELKQDFFANESMFQLTVRSVKL